MTKQRLPAICDFCAKEISSEMKYTAQLSQTGEKGVKGEFITANNKCDMCHPCFLEICKNGFKPKWIKKIKDEQGKWNDHELEEQATL